MVFMRVFDKGILVNNLTINSGGTVLNTPGGDNAISRDDTIEESTVLSKCDDKDRKVDKFNSVVGDRLRMDMVGKSSVSTTLIDTDSNKNGNNFETRHKNLTICDVGMLFKRIGDDAIVCSNSMMS